MTWGESFEKFADQTTNKDKMNQLTPANGGCGVNFFEAEAKAKCSRDTRETLVLLGNHIEGNVQTVVDTRAALIAGMVGGLLAGTVLLIGRLVFGRKS